jgi:predicted aspartyl protease
MYQPKAFRLLLRPLLFLLALHLVAHGAHAAAISLDVLQRDGFGMVEIKRPQPNVLTVIAEINGRKVRLIVDTGWGSDGISMDSGLFNAAGMPTEGSGEFGRSASGKDLGEVKRVRAERVVIGNVEIKNVPLYVGSFRALRNEQFRRQTAAEGFIGAGFLRTCSAVVDLQNLKLYLRPPGTGRRAVLGPALRGAGLAEVPFEVTGHNCLVEVEINEFAGTMFLDTGASLAGLDSRVAPKIKASAYKSRAGFIDAAGVISQTELAKLRSFKIGGVPARASDIRMGKYGFYVDTRGKVIGLLGMDILGPNGTIIDFGAKKLYFYPLT